MRTLGFIFLAEHALLAIGAFLAWGWYRMSDPRGGE
jgi:hypothetical protein